MARRLGATDAEIAALARGDVSGFPDDWQAPFLAAEEITRHGGRLSAETYARLAGAWSEAQIVEIVAVIGVFNYFNRFANALEIPPTR
ncbi:MAG TPA: hypothetical protein VHB25_00450 [Gemmatimonadaceae bacterium]|nr:hypothetical protein [Gemmatimonadaceae bacterium]